MPTDESPGKVNRGDLDDPGGGAPEPRVAVGPRGGNRSPDRCLGIPEEAHGRFRMCRIDNGSRDNRQRPLGDEILDRFPACMHEVGIGFEPDDPEPLSEAELGVLASVHPHVVDEVSVLHRLDGGTGGLVPVMQPEDDCRAPTLLDCSNSSTINT